MEKSNKELFKVNVSGPYSIHFYSSGKHSPLGQRGGENGIVFER